MKNALVPSIVVLVAVALLPVLYALSIGPALRFNLLDSDTQNLIYGPLDAVTGAFWPIQALLNWYLGLWGR